MSEQTNDAVSERSERTNDAVSERSERTSDTSDTVSVSGSSATDQRKQMLIDSFGGIRGVIDSALPVVVFVIANTIGGLTVAVWSAIATGLGIVVLRLVRKQSLQQAFSGFFGVAIAAFIANRTGEAKGYFLLGIWGSLAYSTLFGLSVVIRRPLIGLIWEWVSPSPRPWRTRPRLVRVYAASTLLWSGLFLSRFLVQNSLYGADQTGWLAAARLAMGYPLTIGLLAITVLWVRRVRRQDEEAAVPAVAGTETPAGSAAPTTGT